MGSWLRAIAGACLLGPLAVRAEDPGPPPERPIPWQDAGPFAQLFLQLPFEAPEPVARGALEVSTKALYANSIARERGAELSVDVSVETAVHSELVRYGLPRGFELQLSFPDTVKYGGFLGRPIKFVEGLFGRPNPLRAGRPSKGARFRVARPDGAGLDWSGNGWIPGDPWVGVKRRIRAEDGWGPAVSWRAALQLPIAPVPLGSGLFEVATGVLVARTFGATRVLVEGDAMIPDGRAFTAARLRTRPHFALQLGVARRLARWLTGMVQASTHTSALAGTGVDVVDGTATYLLAGVGVEPTPRTSIAFALVENVLNPSRGADISAVLELAFRP